MTASEGRTVSVVVPVYNEAGWIDRCVERVLEEVERSPFGLDRVVVVDDGSTDRTPEVVDALAGRHPGVEAVHQPNSGRFLARKAGLDRTRGEFVLLVDSRVILDRGAIAYIGEHLAPEARVWNGHVEVQTKGNPFAVFWDTLTKIAWAEYFSNPRLTHFGLDRFDRYPKGTGCFFAPRDVLTRGFEQFTTYYEDLRDASDDTSLIRDIAAHDDIWISPGFGCTYASRSTLRQFLAHAYKRGTFFVDGHLRRGARFAPVIAAFYPLSILGVVLLVVRPFAAVVVLVAGVGLAAALTAWKRQPVRSIVSVAALVPPFVGVYGLGMWRGLALLVRSRVR